MKQLHSRQGFTLIDLIVVLALLAVVTSMGTVLFVRMNDLWSELKIGAELDARAQQVFSAIESDLSQAVNSQIAGFGLKGVQGSVKGGRQILNQIFVQDSFTLPVQVPMIGGGSAAALVGYGIEPSEDGSDWVLVRTQKPIRGEGEPAKLKLAEGIVQMRVEYAGETGAWQQEWTLPGHPRAVRVSLSLGLPGNTERMQSARKAVFEVNVP